MTLKHSPIAPPLPSGLLFAALLVLCEGGAAEPADRFKPEDRNHWAFQPVQRPEPKATHSQWVRNSIDAFILAELEAKGIQPGSPADKLTLLRRASLDLIGLPPTPEEVKAFVTDHSSDAFDKAVERLLASPHYGERWARHWLDLARYAESEGFKSDETRPYAWRYRDYVIKSFNDDKPYDRFIKEQIAGDELWPGDPNARVATAFNRHYPDESNARNLMQRRQEILNDITDTVGAVFTGLTYACARCHDHKYDPILQADYYRLQAFFANTAADDSMVLTSSEAVRRYREKHAIWEEKTCDLREELDCIEELKRKAIVKDFVDKYPEEIQAALAKPESERNAFECQMVAKAKLYLDPASHQYIAKSESIGSSLKGDVKKRWDELMAELKKFDDLLPDELPIGTGMVDLGDEAPKTYLLNRGAYDAPKEEVEPGFLTLFEAKPAKLVSLPGGHSTGRRGTLANLLADAGNPLTARVMVNRIWQHHFGKGIVATPSNFGLRGDEPTHPDLLDDLARRFLESGWSVKAMHRLIMTSETYQLASAHAEDNGRRDPDNKLYWRFDRRRLDAESIRDATLAVAGQLNLKRPQPHPFPSMETWTFTQHSPFKAIYESNHRSVYLMTQRIQRHPFLALFDGPDPNTTTDTRTESTVALQALFMMNNQFVQEQAAAFARRLLESAQEDCERIRQAHELAWSRLPQPTEVEKAVGYLQRYKNELARTASPEASRDLDAWTSYARILLTANEFVYVD